MILRDTFITALSAFLLTPIIFTLLSATNAQVMQSTNYRIQTDSVNFGGGYSSSTNYTLESTAGEIATGESLSTNYALRAGYQQLLSSSISMSTPDPVTMTPNLQGVTGGTSNGSTTVTIITDSPAGYTLTIAALESPALRSDGDTIADYVPVGNPDFTFTTDASDTHFGYSPAGVDVVDRFKDDGASLCNTGSFETALACWDGLDIVDETIVEGTGANVPLGATTTIYFMVGIGGSVSQPPGTYVATTTLTALAV